MRYLTEMMNIKCFSILESRKLLRFYAQVSSPNFSFQKNGPASEDEIKNTVKFYETVATKYLASNNLVGLGLIDIWRRALADSIQVSNDIKILDAAAGTGLNTLKLLEKCKHLGSNLNFPITMFDINPHMMKVGQDNFKRQGYNQNLVKYVEGDLHKLPFHEGSFDVVIASLINRPNVDFGLVLKEINRVLKSEGKIVIMDFCFSQNPTIIQRIYCNYVQYVASKIEKVILGNLETAKFVSDTIREIIAKTEVEELLKEANFQNIKFKPLSLGIAGLTTAVKF